MSIRLSRTNSGRGKRKENCGKRKVRKRNNEYMVNYRSRMWRGLLVFPAACNSRSSMGRALSRKQSIPASRREITQRRSADDGAGRRFAERALFVVRSPTSIAGVHAGNMVCPKSGKRPRSDFCEISYRNRLGGAIYCGRKRLCKRLGSPMERKGRCDLTSISPRGRKSLSEYRTHRGAADYSWRSFIHRQTD